MSNSNSNSSNPQPNSTYQTHRAASTLLFPHRQPLSKPTPQKRILSPPPSTSTSTSTSTAQPAQHNKSIIEADLAAAPQPFLDPVLWARLKERERDTETESGSGTGSGGGSGRGREHGHGHGHGMSGYGRMAVRGRMGGREV